MTVANRILSALLAVALVLGGLLAATEIVLALVGRPAWLVPHEQWSTWLRQQTWDAGIVRAVLAGLAVLGVLLLAPAVRRGRPAVVALPARQGGATPGVRVTAARRGIEQALAGAAGRTSGVSGATASVGARTARVQARTSTRSSENLQAEVTTAVTDRLADLGLADTLRPRVSLSRKEAR